jgi:hypothetical protein
MERKGPEGGPYEGVIYVSQSTDVALKTAYNMSSVIWEAILSP